MSIKVSLKDIVRELTPEESALELWRATEMHLMGIKMYLDTPEKECVDKSEIIEDLFKEHIITEFDTALEYSMALSKAESMILDYQPVTETLRSKLIAVKNKIDKKISRVDKGEQHEFYKPSISKFKNSNV